MTHDIQTELEELEKTLLEAETGKRGFLYTGRQEFLVPYNNATQKIDNELYFLRSTIDNEVQTIRLNELETTIESYINYMAEVIELRQAGKEQEAKNRVISGEGAQYIERLQAQLDKIQQAEEDTLLQKQQIADRAQKFAAFVSWGSTLLIIAIGLFISFSISRIIRNSLGQAAEVTERVSDGDLTYPIEITSTDEVGQLLGALKNMTQSLNTLISQVRQSGLQVTSSTTQIASTSKQLEITITDQVASTSQITATAQEIAVTSAQLTQTMEQVAERAGNTAITATSGQQDLERMEITIRQLAEATTSISSRLGIISEKANNINTVVTTITKVADQTNLLSLNAAIEAEKAGEYGAGFAVVAREIRRLADQSAVATLEIESMVKEMQLAVSTGVMEMDKFTQEVGRGVSDIQNISQQMAQVIEQVQSLTPSFETVNQGMEAQSEGAQQIRGAMEQLNDSAQQTADSVRDTRGAIEQLNEAAQGLKKEIARFKVTA
ncbi:methyl-accepting chemotaxis protein [Zarconia navalis]|nr:methyl-accepting chemotaxis protein [Zarconia navalis]